MRGLRTVDLVDKLAAASKLSRNKRMGTARLATNSDGVMASAHEAIKTY